jgi:sulfotransferase family protein
MDNIRNQAYLLDIKNNIKKQKIFIHVGLHKTGTTFLQKKVFPKMHDVNLITVFNTEIIGNKNFILCSMLSDIKINLISDEALSCVPYSPGITQNRYEIASRLYRLFPNAKIIVTFREKSSWIKSVYKQYHKKDRATMGISFDVWYDTIFDKDLLDYKKYELFLKGLFSDVLVLQYEELKEQPDEFIKKICMFMGVSLPKYENIIINKSLSDKNSERIRKMNRILDKLKMPYYVKWLTRKIIMKLNNK